MPNLTMSIPHQLPRPEARQRVERLIADLKQQYGGTVGRLEERWTGDRLDFTISAMGISVPGHVDVEDQAVKVEVVLPLALAMLAGGVRQTIEQEGRKMLGNRPPG
jgi:putative polyhydroxyalkanoate system protein